MIKIEKYRDPWLAQKVDEFIGFYPREFYIFDNFSSFRILVDGVLYSTVEHAYQAMKFIETAPKIAQKIADAYSAQEARAIATKNRNKQREDWHIINLDIMEKLLRLKIEQNPYIKKKLLLTENYLLCEDSPNDDFWGIGSNRDGRNELGKLWMKLREEILLSNK